MYTSIDVYFILIFTETPKVISVASLVDVFTKECFK